MTKNLSRWTLQANLVLIEPYDEEGLSPHGLWVDHTWEPQAGHAFGRILAKSDKYDSPDARDRLAEISVGDLVLFTRSAYIKMPSYEGDKLLFVNVEDIQSVLVMEEGDYERYGAACVD